MLFRSAAPAAGGWGKPVSRRVHRVAFVWCPAGGASEAAVLLDRFLLTARFPSGGGAPWIFTVSRASSWGPEIGGFPRPRSRPDPGAADLGGLRRFPEAAVAGDRGVQVEVLGRRLQSWDDASLGASPGRCAPLGIRSSSVELVVHAARQRSRARSSSVPRVRGAGGWILLRRRRWRWSALGATEVEEGLLLQCCSLVSLWFSPSSSYACMYFVLLYV